MLRQIADQAVTDRAIVRDREGEEAWLYLRPLFEAECSVARLLCWLNREEHPLPKIDSASALAWAERRMGIELAETQKQATRQATTAKVMVITGGPGVEARPRGSRCGLLEIFAAKRMKCLLCAPTGRAAKRLQESTRRDARTISHRYVGIRTQRIRLQEERRRIRWISISSWSTRHRCSTSA